MRSPLDTATDYLAVWNEASAPERRRRLDAWHPDARYRDPLMEADGREAVAAMIEGARERFPGLAFRLHGTPDGHGPFVRFSWALAPDCGPAVAAGTDVVRLDAAGRIAEVIGFLDEVRS
ncbi:MULTISPECIES: nuclear transport factor 2 family protein [Methylobacterium]|uniref:nuclear transport factor 2 family protein n=1 Tax=Methylobacterium TaxID=407 RepID=UPI0013EB5EA2|nr:nuclear transport factor 2 family protein [Methylobacterium sp. DB0501]NGM33104.1 nuclear transport factor 2 family protein [Methylobacterium sp. DB0501]